MDSAGVENYVLRFLRYLPDGNSVSVLVRSNKRGNLFPKYMELGTSIHFQPIGYLNILDWYRVYRYFVNEKFTTVCDFGGNFAGPTMLLSYLAGVRIRIAFYRRSSNAFSESAIKLLYNQWMNRLVFTYATRILSNSQHAFDYFFPNHKDERRFRVIPNGVALSVYRTQVDRTDARSAFKLPNDHFIVGHVGRYDWSKNHETIFKVARSLKSSSSKVTFVFAGMGTDSNEFIAKLDEYDIHDVCIGYGLLENVPLFYKTMDIFYFPSITEGQPNALIEAMMAGLPVLTSSIPPIKELMPYEMHGLLLDPLDYEIASVEIQRCLKQPDFQQKHVVNTEFLDIFNPERNFEMFKEELDRE